MTPLAIREARANWRSRPVLAIAAVIGCFVPMFAALAIDSVETQRTANDVAELRYSGFATLIVSPDDERGGRLQDSQCDALGGMSGVRGASWIRRAGTARLWSVDGMQLDVGMVGAETLDLLASVGLLDRWRGENVVIDEIHGLAPQTRATIVTGDVARDDTAIVTTDLGVLGQSFAAQMLTVARTTGDEVTACIVLAEFEHRAAVQRALRAAFEPTSGFSVQWALPSADQIADPIAEYRENTTRLAWIAAILATVAVVLFVVRIRRQEYAFYATAGVMGRRLFGLIATDVVGLVAIAVGSCAAVSAVAGSFAGMNAVAVRAGLSTGSRIAAVAVIAAVVIASAAARGVERRAQDVLKGW